MNPDLALLVALLSVLATPVTAWLTFRWTRVSERDRQAHDDRMEATRWQRDEMRRRAERGEAAAKDLVALVDDAAIRLRDGNAKQADFEQAYHQIRQLSLLITDDETRARMLDVASAVYFFHQANEAEPHLTRNAMAGAYASATNEILRAYLLGRPCPPTPRLERLTALINKGGQMIFEEVGEELDPDLLADPAASDARN